MDEILFGSMTEAAASLRRGELSAAELRAAQLARIAEVNPRVNAVVEVASDVVGPSGDGPLRGVPMTIKEAIPVAGMRSTWGLPDFRDAVASHDAEVVRRLRVAGADIIGTTNVATLLADYTTTNEVYGTTSNPYDLDRSPGGSSGGSAAAVAAGLSFCEYATDLAGSIRIPAALCGVYGLKPTVGTVSQRRFQPPWAPPQRDGPHTVSSLGPIARSPADLRSALSVTGGPDDPASRAYSWRLAPPRRTRLGEFRVGVVLDADQAPVAADVGAAISAVVDAIAKSGATIVEGWPVGVDPDASAASFGYQVGAFLQLQQSADADGGTVATFAAQEGVRLGIQAAWDAYFDDVDVLLCPVTPRTAFRHQDKPGHELAWWITHPSLAGLPALSAPIGMDGAGLPVGLQIIGPRHEDDSAITFAELLANRIGGYHPP